MSAQKLTAPKGFADVLPSESWKWQVIEQIARDTARLYGYAEIRTPILENSALFHRGVGETSDIVHKETFTFNDRGGDSMTMRPEGTAGVVRAVIEAGLLDNQGARVKCFYIGANFRYEKPQKGRLRQHHQFGAEAFGVADPDQDVECILLQLEFYRRCGVKDLALRINSLGDSESKQRYRDALVQFLSPKKESLSEDSRRRLTENPLRILDSKDEHDVRAVQGAPSAGDYLSEKSAKHFARVQDLLRDADVAFTVDGTLVRGFDYYTDTLWEVTAGGLGSQNAIGGGGRYDNLVETLGGRPTPGVGFGSGLERLLIALEGQGVQLAPPNKPVIFLVSQNDAARTRNFQLLQQLRHANFAADMDLSGRSFKGQMKLVGDAAFLLITGEQELKDNTVTLKVSATREQKTVPIDALIPTLEVAMPSKALD